MDGLKPCPFCGGHDVHAVHAEEHRNEYGEVDGGIIVCFDCLASFYQQEATCQEDLVKAWNRRVNDA